MANSSNQLSHPLRSEPTSKPAGLHLNNWLRLSHDRGPPNVKELRLVGVRTFAEGNVLLPAFVADYNAHFAKPPANQKDLHRPLRW